MEKIFNWDDYKESSYISTEGRYTLKIVKYDTKETANNNTCHVYTCETKEGEQINVNLYLVEKAMWKYKAFVKACGLTAEGQGNLDELPKSLIGRKFVGEVKRQPDRINVETGLPEQSKYFEVAKFYPVEG